ncbi:hypothetical protein MTO96_029161 [Rhipicephalus appendiculatus]
MKNGLTDFRPAGDACGIPQRVVPVLPASPRRVVTGARPRDLSAPPCRRLVLTGDTRWWPDFSERFAFPSFHFEPSPELLARRLCAHRVDGKPRGFVRVVDDIRNDERS